MGTPGNVLIGPGVLYAAPIGTTEPASASAALNGSFREVGYTEDGNTFSYEITNEPVEVEEEFDPVRYATTGRRSSVTFEMAEATVANLALAVNAGADTTNDAQAFEPPDPGDEVRVILVFDSEEGARWIFRQCLQAGNVAMARKKAPDKARIPVTFRLEKPTSGAPFRVYPTSAGLI